MLETKLTAIQYTPKSKKNTQLLLVLFAFFLQSICNVNSYADEYVSVGVVSVTFLMENAPQSALASSSLKKKFSPQEKKLADDLKKITALEEELNQIKLDKKNIELQRIKERELRSIKRERNLRLQDFREELRFARDTALDDVQKEVFKAIDQVRIQKKIDIVLQDYISASKKVDITPAVLEYLKAKVNGLTAPVPESTADK